MRDRKQEREWERKEPALDVGVVD